MIWGLILVVFCSTVHAVDWDVETPLDEYVNRAESVYGYELINTESVIGATVYTLNMTSLTWFDDQLTTTPVWWHWVVVVIPDDRTYDDSALLHVGGGNNEGAPPGLIGTVGELIDFSRETGAVSCLMEMNPNQPLTFIDDEFGAPSRSEDAIIGYTWRLFINQNYTQPEIILQFPMTKSAKLAVDTLIDFAATVDPAIQITQVMPMGYSKRGWVVWLLGSTDPRVFAMAPIVFDLLNFNENLVHHYMSLGGWSWAFRPYHETEVPRYLHHPRTQEIGFHVDSMSYVERMTMPKLLMGATGDQFFIPDGTHYWWDNMIGENHYMLFENDDHVLGGHGDFVWSNTQAFFVGVREGIARPEYSFTRSEDVDSGEITLTSVTAPNWVRVWVAHNTERVCPAEDTSAVCRRDFRLARLDIPADTLIQWDPTLLVDQGSGVYSASFPTRNDYGKTIFHLEMSYPGPGGREYRFSTEANIIADTMPFPNCTTEIECLGELV